MTKSATRCTGHRVKVRIAILMLGVTLTMGPEVFAWGFRNFGGGFGEGAGPSPSGGDGYSNSTGGQMYIYPSRARVRNRSRTIEASAMAGPSKSS
jgi:hypothetical protein